VPSLSHFIKPIDDLLLTHLLCTAPCEWSWQGKQKITRYDIIYPLFSIKYRNCVLDGFLIKSIFGINLMVSSSYLHGRYILRRVNMSNQQISKDLDGINNRCGQPFWEFVWQALFNCNSSFLTIECHRFDKNGWQRQCIISSTPFRVRFCLSFWFHIVAISSVTFWNH